MSKINIELKTIRVSEILEQIDKLNEIIGLHRLHNGDVSTIQQYVEMKREYTVELSELLHHFQLNPHFEGLAA